MVLFAGGASDFSLYGSFEVTIKTCQAAYKTGAESILQIVTRPELKITTRRAAAPKERTRCAASRFALVLTRRCVQFGTWQNHLDTISNANLPLYGVVEVQLHESSIKQIRVVTFWGNRILYLQFADCKDTIVTNAD